MTLHGKIHHTIDLLRITISQNGLVGKAQALPGGDQKKGSRRNANAGTLDPQVEFSPEILAARPRPRPPCCLFNNGSCSLKHHHMTNGFRRLHVCSSCVYHKCLLIPHPEECESNFYFLFYFYFNYFIY